MRIFINKIIITCLLIGIACCPLHSYALEVNVEAGEGVPQSVVDDARKGIAMIEKFYQDMYGLDINYPIRLYITSGKEKYIAALNDELGITREEAEKYYYNTSGVTSGHTIVSDIRACGGRNGLLEHVAHEITHQYQKSVCGSKNQLIKWMSEGTADVIAVSVLAMNGRGSVNAMAKDRMAALQAVPRAPELSAMHGNDSWMKTANTTGQGVNYYTADMAVILLVSKSGYEPLFTYFRLLRETNAQQAFLQAFGMSLMDFEQEFHDYMVENGVAF